MLRYSFTYLYVCPERTYVSIHAEMADYYYLQIICERGDIELLCLLKLMGNIIVFACIHDTHVQSDIVLFSRTFVFAMFALGTTRHTKYYKNRFVKAC